MVEKKVVVVSWLLAGVGLQVSLRLRWFSRSLFSSSNIFSSNCVRLLILYINYRRGQDTVRGFKVKLNKNNK